jgi:ABC-type transport system involved in multi-copper enzyme maturation permease subunit
MLATLINKELKAVILSPKFTGTFIVCTLLILLSIYAGLREYKESVRRYDSASQLVSQELQHQTAWSRLHTKAYRAPDPMQIFVSGLEYDIGRWSPVSGQNTAKLKNSVYSDESIYALFRVVDFTFIVQFVLTLFAILFTYNAVCGEREDGTLRLVFSSPVSRAQYLIAKCAGAWLGLVVPISIPILLGMLLVLLSGVPITSDHWLRICLLAGISLLLFTFFIVLGVFISLLTRGTSLSLMVALVVWVLFALIIPRAGVMFAGNLVDVPSVAEIEGQINGYAKDQWEEFYLGMEDRFAKMHGTGGEGIEMSEEKMWELMQAEDSLRRLVTEEINLYDLRLREDLRQRKLHQEKLALTLARFSPASSYQIGAMSLAGTSLDVKTRYEEDINEYRNQFVKYADQMQAETGDLAGRMISMEVSDSSSNFTMSSSRDKKALDLSGLPQFDPPHVTLAEAMAPAVTDFGILALYTILTFMGAFIAFLRYDLR